jgi:hypothetical protein
LRWRSCTSHPSFLRRRLPPGHGRLTIGRDEPVAGPRCAAARVHARAMMCYHATRDSITLITLLCLGHLQQADPFWFPKWYESVVTQHTNACCSMQVIDITLVKYHFTNITSLGVVQQKHSGIYSNTKYYKP